MKTKIRKADNVSILDLRGKITIGAGDVMLRDHINRVLEQGERSILLNMADVTYMDSSGMGELISSYTSVTKRDGKLKLLNLPAKIRDLLQITQLITIFEVYDNETEAVRSFS
ncbi:MAG: STAS domain-containing protein [Acidobacteriota bacterium]|nr:STAS domain-containing protein [Candidatus Aminicenantes bacterium]